MAFVDDQSQGLRSDLLDVLAVLRRACDTLQQVGGTGLFHTPQRPGDAVVGHLFPTNQAVKQRDRFRKIQFTRPPDGARESPFAAGVKSFADPFQDRRFAIVDVGRFDFLDNGDRVNCQTLDVPFTDSGLNQFVINFLGLGQGDRRRSPCAFAKDRSTPSVTKINDELIVANFAQGDFVDLVRSSLFKVEYRLLDLPQSRNSANAWNIDYLA